MLGSTSYDPWGVVQSGTVPTFGFTGELQTDGLVHLRTRWYNPSQGTLLGRDPYPGLVGRSFSLHPYAYAEVNPILYTDPTGKCLGWMWGDPYCAGRQVDLDAGAAYGIGVFDAVTAPFHLAYALTQGETYATMGQGAQALVANPAGSMGVLRGEWIDPIWRGGSLVWHDPTLAARMIDQNPYEVGRAMGGFIPYGSFAKVGLRNLAPSSSFFFRGQVDVTCYVDAPKIAAFRRLPNPDLQRGEPSRFFGAFDPLRRHKYGLSHVAVRNLDGSITDRTILYNIENQLRGSLPLHLQKYRAYDTFDPFTYRYLIKEWKKAVDQTSQPRSTSGG